MARRFSLPGLFRLASTTASFIKTVREMGLPQGEAYTLLDKVNAEVRYVRNCFGPATSHIHRLGGWVSPSMPGLVSFSWLSLGADVGTASGRRGTAGARPEPLLVLIYCPPGPLPKTFMYSS